MHFSQMDFREIGIPGWVGRGYCKGFEGVGIMVNIGKWPKGDGLAATSERALTHCALLCLALLLILAAGTVSKAALVLSLQSPHTLEK